MANNSKKHDALVSEPMGDKPVTDIPGIGSMLGGRLRDLGFPMASNLFGQYLALNNKEKFSAWLRVTCGADSRQQRDCCAAMEEYKTNNI